MAETKIQRLRNLLTPIKNYFKLREDYDNCNDEELAAMIVSMKERDYETIKEILPEIWSIIAEIPDNACEGKNADKSDRQLTIPDVSNNEVAVCETCDFESEGNGWFKCKKCGYSYAR